MLQISAADERLSYFAPQEVDRSRMGGKALRLQRFPRHVADHLKNDIGPLANTRSSSGCIISFKTDSPWVVLQLSRLRHHQYASVGIDCEVYMDGFENPWWHVSASPDLRSLNGDCEIRFATGLERGKDPRIVLIHLPLISTCAVAGFKFTRGSQLEVYQLPQPRLLAIGDSLTQGFSVQAPTQHWLHQVSRQQDMCAWNLGLGGLGVDMDVFRWALEQPWDLVTVGLGSNHAWSDVAADNFLAHADNMLGELSQAAIGRLCILQPPWKPMCGGLGPSEFMGVPLDDAAAQRLQRVQNDLQQLCSQREVLLVEDLLPQDHQLFVDGLHPAASGMQHYAQVVNAALV
ncbi:MAG: SGNH/GDSL hydrolase family protein [Planctomycetes bacterium]|nr:SGNH/GDSL hydrolase family protein [Planctomycetota bacterium]